MPYQNLLLPRMGNISKYCARVFLQKRGGTRRMISAVDRRRGWNKKGGGSGGTARVACVCVRACGRACVRAHFCACVRACLRVCMRAYAHLNMRTKVTKHSGQRARTYVQLIACKCAGSKVSGFTLQHMTDYIQQLCPLGITAEHWGTELAVITGHSVLSGYVYPLSRTSVYRPL